MNGIFMENWKYPKFNMDIHYNHKKIEKSLDMNGILISNVAVPEDFRG